MSDSNGSKNIVRNVLVNVIVAAVTGAIVFAFTMTSVVGQVNSNRKDVLFLTDAVKDIKAQELADRNDFTSRMTSIAALVQEQTRQSGELIVLLKIQQQQKIP